MNLRSMIALPSMLPTPAPPPVPLPVNKFVVSRNCTGNMIAILKPPKAFVTRADALLLAALLVDAADDTCDLGAFKSVLRYVQAHHESSRSHPLE